MFEKITLLEKRFEELSTLLAETEIYSNPQKLASVQKEYSSLEKIVTLFREYKSCKNAEEEAEELMSSDDHDLKELAKQEYAEQKKKREETEQQLKIALLPHDPDDDKNITVEIRAGAGGEEAALFAAVLYRMYGMYSDRMGWGFSPVSSNPTELGGLKEIIFQIDGKGAYSRLKFESGVHRVQRVPETESQGRIHTSTVTVAVLPEVDEVEFEIDPKDLQIDTFRSSGAGGQHINKTESAIRITHLPTGLVVECQDERSQYKNKDRAMSVLRTKLYNMKKNEQEEKIASERKSQVGTGDRSERIRTYNYPQSRITDHRIGLTLYKLDAFLNGDMDEVIDALLSADQAEKLNAANGENTL